MLKIFYFYYYLFYTRIIPDDEPHATTLFTLSVSEAFYYIIILDIVYTNIFCEIIPIWGLVSILATIILKNYIYFYKMNNKKQIIKKKN